MSAIGHLDILEPGTVVYLDGGVVFQWNALSEVEGG